MARTNRKITIPVSIGYGLTDIMGGGAFTVIGAWLLYFYTTFVGLSPVEAASIVAIARIVDAIVSLFMGSFTDHFYKNALGKKFGRRRFFLLIGAPLMLVYILLWVTGMNFWFYLAVYLAFEIIAAMVLIPWETLPSEMTKDFNSRTKLSTCRMFLSASGTFLATFIPGLLIGYFGEHDPNAYFINGVVFAVMFMLCVFISWKVTWERELTPEMLQELERSHQPSTFGEKVAKVGQLFKEYASTLKVRAFRKHLAIYLFSFTAKDVYNTVFVFFCVYCLNVSSSLAGTLLSMSIVGLPVTLLAGVAIIKYGPSRLYVFAYTLMMLCLVGLFMVYQFPTDSKVTLLVILAGLYQVGRCVLEFTPWNVFPFIPDIDEMITRQRREGLFAAVMTFSRKTTVAIATFIVGLMLQSGGFVKGSQAQPEQAINTIATLLFAGTAGLLLLALWQAVTFHLNKRTHKIFVDEVDRLKAHGAKQDVDPETRRIVEDLTGYNYDALWCENAPQTAEPVKSAVTLG
ncbi:MFS transporter [Citrobacter rodentium]|uniref:Major Facilitator Superfamily transporter n=2 Tax=Citrobacter rodentium TaxID=67825 RepID=D2TIC1_CITRI|nr:MFS transporter [Citrobacter rodentium]KIQ48696.1 major facilitator transporter [Citrobacter rodentium]QBY28080.1 MFS transporter [Citrobacter rodentium]UHO30041.1 MFS transporter [Citrobacter rodentium NBRC 105723 = DSM 16636]CBG88248.1 Major Facilitator Superfamily transporter [Citrobacter rodentium ICC168]HAT8011455.1 MFS transporter [Citrobacter rodentium NBRC 105723 = DSM 16636]